MTTTTDNFTDAVWLNAAKIPTTATPDGFKRLVRLFTHPFKEARVFSYVGKEFDLGGYTIAPGAWAVVGTGLDSLAHIIPVDLKRYQLPTAINDLKSNN